MAAQSSIEWCDASWNPIAGCSFASAGCTNCYAMGMARRHELMSVALGRVSPYAGLTRVVNGKAVWTGDLRLVEDAVTLPLRWKKPKRIFVNSMSDLFHESVPDEWIDRVFAVMALAPWHTFQVLTKRAARMRAYLRSGRAMPVGMEAFGLTLEAMTLDPRSTVGAGVQLKGDIAHLAVWPLPNVWLGVSAEDQRRADERVPDLLATSAAVRFVSAEPLIGDWYPESTPKVMGGEFNCLASPAFDGLPRLDLVIVGGESGHSARVLDLDHVSAIVEQCARAGVACFVKQLGRSARMDRTRAVQAVALGAGWQADGPGSERGVVRFRDSHGGDMAEWPPELRVRQMPTPPRTDSRPFSSAA